MQGATISTQIMTRELLHMRRLISACAAVVLATMSVAANADIWTAAGAGDLGRSNGSWKPAQTRTPAIPYSA